MRRAKIVCTLGPATAGPERVHALVAAGMDVARLNLSHGTWADHEARYREVRAAGDATGRAVAVLVDLQGPKIRLGPVPGGPVVLAAGDTLVLTTEPVAGDARRISVTYDGLPADVGPGSRILLADGAVQLEVQRVDGREVQTVVVDGGTLSTGKGVNLPGADVGLPALTAKDETDLRRAVRLGADWVALSFVRSAHDVDRVRRVMAEEGRVLPVVAKLERPQAVEHLEEIVDAFDGLMVARGDLGVEMPLERVPLVQKQAVALARRNAKPVIVATQMLESMIEEPRPTRAEASDVANAVWDGADALMLSGETGVGRHPLEAVRVMARIIEQVEDASLGRVATMAGTPSTIGGAIARAAIGVGETVGAGALCAFTVTGDTARRLARHRCGIPLLVFTPTQAVRSQLALTWGAETFLMPEVRHTDQMVRHVDGRLLELARVREGDLVVVVAGSPPSTPGSTNAMRVHRVGTAQD